MLLFYNCAETHHDGGVVSVLAAIYCSLRLSLAVVDVKCMCIIDSWYDLNVRLSASLHL